MIKTTTARRNVVLLMAVVAFSSMAFVFNLVPHADLDAKEVDVYEALFRVVMVLAIILGLLGIKLVHQTQRIQEPRVHRMFFLFSGVSAALMPLSIVLQEFINLLWLTLFREDFWERGPFDPDPYFVVMAVYVCPPVFAIAAAGSIVLQIFFKPRTEPS